MYAAGLLAGIEKGDQVLTPAFDCDAALQPFRALEADCVFYRSDPLTLEADREDLQRRIGPRTKLIHIVQHFGMPQPWEEIVKIREKTGIPILEDNAYSLFSSYRNRPFGTFGDMAVFSLRKNFPLTDGGMLCLNAPGYSLQRFPEREPSILYREQGGALLGLTKRRLASIPYLGTALRFLRHRLGQGTVVAPPLYCENAGIPVVAQRDRIGTEFSCDYLRPMSAYARKHFFSYTDGLIREIGEKKRFFYAQATLRLKQAPGIKILWPELPEGIVPFGVLLLIRRGRDRLYERLCRQYEVLTWPTLPGAVLERLQEFPEVLTLGRQLLILNLPADRILRKDFASSWGKLLERTASLSAEHS